MLSQVTFGGAYTQVGAGTSTDDMKKAFQVLSSMGMILVPFQSWDYTNYTYTGGTQLIDLGATSLTLRGLASQQGFVERAFPMQNDVVAFSDRSLQVVDISNRDQPTAVGTLDMARPVLGLTVVGNQIVELSGDWTIGNTELAVTNASTPDQAVPLATVQIPAPNAQTFQDGNIMWVLGRRLQLEHRLAASGGRDHSLEPGAARDGQRRSQHGALTGMAAGTPGATATRRCW